MPDAPFEKMTIDEICALVKQSGVNNVTLTGGEPLLQPLIKELIEKYPQVITRESLLDSIWGYDYYGDTRIVDAHIKNIRKKITLPYIKTVKGIGYTLDKNI